MFKFFRKYQGWFLAVGFTALMIVFLLTSVVPNASSMFARDPGSEVVGYVNDNQKITRREVGEANADLDILKRLSLPAGDGMGDNGGKENRELRWALLLREARSLGIDTSNGRVYDALWYLLSRKEDGERSEGKVEALLSTEAAQLRTTPQMIVKAVRDWLVVQQHTTLLMGREYISPLGALAAVREVKSQARETMERLNQPQLAPFIEQQASMQIAQIMASVVGPPRVSEPLAKRLAADIAVAPELSRQPLPLGSKVTAAALVVKATADTATRPSDAAMQDLFGQYKDNLPGTSEPFHLGYRFPDRVKIEYAEVPYDKVKAAVRVREDEAMQYYDEHREEFPAPETEPEAAATSPWLRTGAASRPAPKPQRYEDVADRVRAQLLDVKAQDLAGRIVKDLKTRLENGLPATGTTGYRDLKDFHSPALATEATKVQDENKVPITVVRKDASWLTAKDLANLLGIAQSMIDAGAESRIAARFVDYVQSAHELKPKDDNPLLSYYLQVGVPSAVLIDPLTRDRYLFRLIEAEPEHSPASLAEVAADVERDARKLESYRGLKDQLPTWIERARKSFEDTGNLPGVTVAPPSTFARRMLTAGGVVESPVVEGVGKSGAYVDAVFDQADQLAGSKPDKVKDLPVEKRIGGVAMDGELAVAVFRIDDFKPITVSQYTRAIDLAPALVAALARPKDSPVSLEAIQKRLKYVAEKTATQQP